MRKPLEQRSTAFAAAGSAPLGSDAVAVAGQTAQVLSQVDALLVKAGSDKARILMVQIYLKE